MIETRTLKQSSTNSEVKTEVNAISDYLKHNMPLPQYLPYARFLLDADLSHTAKLLYTLLLDRATLSQKKKLGGRSGTHLCDLSAFQSGEGFRVLYFQRDTRLYRIGKN